MTLLEFVNNTHPNTDKYDLGYIDEFYDRIFTPRKDTALHILEIGIYEGNSILLWRDFFTKATVFGIDLYPCPKLYKQPRIGQYSLNAYTHECLGVLQNMRFDIIIDDGPHTFESMQFFLQWYLPKLNDGGVLVLEDIIDRNWTAPLVNMIDQSNYKVTVIDMRGLQKTTHLLELWKNGLDVIVVEKK
jgi:hypothetical protein